MDCLEFDCPHRIILTAFDWMVLAKYMLSLDGAFHPCPGIVVSNNLVLRGFISVNPKVAMPLTLIHTHILLSFYCRLGFISCPRDSFFMDICIDLSMLWMLWYLMLLFLVFSRIYITCMSFVAYACHMLYNDS